MWTVAVLFVLLLFFFYLIAGIIAVRLLWNRNTARATLTTRAVLILAGFGVLCFLYGRFVEPNWLVTTHVEIRSAKIPPNMRAIRIAHFSDLHAEKRPRLESKLIEAIGATHPDIIVFTGDSMNTPAGLP